MGWSPFLRGASCITSRALCAEYSRKEEAHEHRPIYPEIGPESVALPQGRTLASWLNSRIDAPDPEMMRSLVKQHAERTMMIALALPLATFTALLIRLNRIWKISSGSARAQAALFWPISKEKSLGAWGLDDQRFGAQSVSSQRGDGALLSALAEPSKALLHKTVPRVSKAYAASTAFAPLGPLRRWSISRCSPMLVRMLRRSWAAWATGGRSVGRDDSKMCHGRHLAATVVVKSAGEIRTPKRSHQMITL